MQQAPGCPATPPERACIAVLLGPPVGHGHACRAENPIPTERMFHVKRCAQSHHDGPSKLTRYLFRDIPRCEDSSTVFAMSLRSAAVRQECRLSAWGAGYIVTASDRDGERLLLAFALPAFALGIGPEWRFLQRGEGREDQGFFRHGTSLPRDVIDADECPGSSRHWGYSCRGKQVFCGGDILSRDLGGDPCRGPGANRRD